MTGGTRGTRVQENSLFSLSFLFFLSFLGIFNAEKPTLSLKHLAIVGDGKIITKKALSRATF